MLRLASILTLTLVLSACRNDFLVEKAVKVTDVHTGWYDAGIYEGKNKLVPSISLKLQNITDASVRSIQVNAVFHRVGEETEVWGDHFVRAVDSEGIPAGQTGGLLVLRSNLGYTGTESRLQMLQNSQFVDAKVDVFGKHGARTWQKLGEYTIDRQLLTQ